MIAAISTCIDKMASFYFSLDFKVGQIVSYLCSSVAPNPPLLFIFSPILMTHYLFSCEMSVKEL